MAITNCAECGAEVSTDAPSCPKCGFRVGAKRIRVWQSLLLGAVAIAAAAYAFVNLGWLWALVAFLGVHLVGTIVLGRRNIA